MGNVSGRLEEAPSLYLRDQNRLTFASLHITNGHGRSVLRLAPNAFPSSRVIARKDIGEEGLIEYVQDPDVISQGPPLLLKLTSEDVLNFKFTFNARRREDGPVAAETVINGLTFVVAPSQRVLENLVTREFYADPNLHKNPNVHLVGDYSTDGSSSVQFEWDWVWKPPSGGDDRANFGWRNACSFVEYDRSAHKLSTLAAFSFWVQNPPRSHCLPSSMTRFDMMEQPIRLNSVSECSPERPGDNMEPTSPLEASHDGINIPSVKVDCQRPPGSMMADDGPLFRATIKSLEQKTGAFRSRMKKVLKRAEAAKLAQASCNEAVGQFMKALREAASSNAMGIQPALDHYFDRTYMEIQQFEKQNEENLQKCIIDPLTKLYNMDIKQAEAKKKDFEEESKDYYNFVSRYLGMRNDSLKAKKKVESDSKYQIKRRNFELKRFDYCSFMEDLHGGRKEQEVLSQLTKFADAQAKGYLSAAKKVQELMPQLEALSHEVQETDKEFQLQRTEREERRRQLEKSQKTYVEPENVPSFLSASNISAYQSEGVESGKVDPGVNPRTSPSSSGTVIEHGQSPAIGSSSLPNGSASIASIGVNKFRGIRDLQENGSVESSAEGRRKEGLLWALSRPGSHADPKGLNKQAWHKYWVVLAGGQLCEYSNWKQKLDLHNDPINLRMASVREARSSERRFCFEVITPQYKRVYQATSEDDMSSWILAINNALKVTIEGGASVIMFDASRIENDAEKTKSLQQVLTGRHHNINHTTASNVTNSSSSTLHRRITVGARPNPARTSSSTFGDDPEKLLQIVREADPSNSSCADCGSNVKAEWVSINLGIVLCIECSGLHRSLGTHISKIRSLTLDTISFTPDLVDLICNIGNRASNAVWEGKLDPCERPDHRASRETRLRFITTKYVNRTYVIPLSSTSLFTSPDEALLDAVNKSDVKEALYALALHASPNTIDRSTHLHVVHLALKATGTASVTSPNTNMELSPSSSGSGQPSVPTFPLAELLLQNGGELPGSTSSLQLSHWAKQYIAQKTAKQMGTLAVAGGNLGATNLLSKDEVADREREIRLQKRISSGGRISRVIPLDRALDRS